jgi:hypothetical protein
MGRSKRAGIEEETKRMMRMADCLDEWVGGLVLRVYMHRKG